jgi:hypothetical protein
MINEEQMWKAAHRMSEAADQTTRTADRIDESVQRLAHLLEDGYGGNGVRLIELLEAAQVDESSNSHKKQVDDNANFHRTPIAIHPATADLVRRFSVALLEKLAAAEKKYGYSDGWHDSDWMDECRTKLNEHIAKGDPRDVAAYCAFIWHHGERTAAPAGEPVYCVVTDDGTYEHHKEFVPRADCFALYTTPQPDHIEQHLEMVPAGAREPISDDAKAVGLNFCCGREEKLVCEIAALRNVVQAGMIAGCKQVFDSWNHQFPDDQRENPAQKPSAEPFAWMHEEDYKAFHDSPYTETASVSSVEYGKGRSFPLFTNSTDSAAEPIGEMRENGVTWFGKNPHAFPAGTKFYATQKPADVKLYAKLNMASVAISLSVPFLKHHQDCDWQSLKPCNCGFDKALSAIADFRRMNP